jgi:hypothetical protein
LSILYEDIFDAAHADRNGLVFLRSVSDDVDAGPLEASSGQPELTSKRWTSLTRLPGITATV